jgi:hypothetical protein
MVQQHPSIVISPGVGPFPTHLKRHRGVVVLVLGILGIMTCVLCGAFAWRWAKRDLAEMDAGVMDDRGRSLTEAGKICGMIAVIVNAVVLGGALTIGVGMLILGWMIN